MNFWVPALVSVTIISIISLIGLFFISVKPEHLQNFTYTFISLAVGGLFGDSFFHLLPESFAKIPDTSEISFLVILGIFTFFSIEKILLWKYEFSIVKGVDLRIKPLGYISLIADSVHNLFDGVLIGSSYLVSFKVGVATTVAILLHEIPHEIGNFGTLIHSGFSIKRALFLNFLTACTAILGTVCTLFFGTHFGGLAYLILPFACGGFIYLAGSDLIPELKKQNSLKNSVIQIFIILSGLGLLYLFTFIEH